VGPLEGAIALWITGQIASPSTLPEPRGSQVRVDAKEVENDGGERTYTARGDVVLRMEDLVLRADEMVYDEAEGTATAKGNVRLVQDLITAYGDEVTVDLATMAADVKSGLFQEKRRTTFRQLSLLKTADELKKTGSNMLTLSGTHLRRIGPRHYLVDHLAFTPCDCNPDNFNWRIKSYQGDVESGERAILYWPVVYLKNIPLAGEVPVLPLPILYLPMSERRSGLLLPEVKWGPPNSFSIDQPLFLTLGRSRDLTITPGYYWGSDSENPKDPLHPPGPFGIQGPRLRAEYRYVLKDGSPLSPNLFRLGGIYDLKHERDPVNPGLFDPDYRRGMRWEAAWYHNENLGKGYYTSVNASVLSDGYYIKDLSADIFQTAFGYLRSTAFLAHRSDDEYAAVDVTLRQDMNWGYNLVGPNYQLYTFNDPNDPTNPNNGKVVRAGRVRGPSTMQRFPALTFALPERSVLGPVNAGLRVEYARIAPLVGLTGDEGTKGTFDPNNPDLDGSQGNGRFDPGDPYDPLRPGEREARDRLDIQPRLSASLKLGDALRLMPYLAAREDLYLGEVTGRTAQRGYVYGGTVLETELGRAYRLSSSTLWHSIVPSVEIRYLPYISGGPLGRSYDEVDVAVPAPPINPPNYPSRPVPSDSLSLPSYQSSVAYAAGLPTRSLLQTVVQIRQKLDIQESGRVRELAWLDLGQGIDLLAERPGDSFLRVGTTQGSLNAFLLARYDPKNRRITQLATGVGANDGRGNAASIRYENLILGGSDALRRGLDELVASPNGYVCPTVFGSSTGPPCPNRAQQITLDATATLFGIQLSYLGVAQPQLYDRDQNYVPSPPSSVIQGIKRSILYQRLGLSYGPACDCWRIGISALFQRGSSAPSFNFIFTITGFGSFGH
jgi:LPS-assembly protein